ncbi:MAG TPA: diacylglycerol kinase family protein [Roseiflexaceae bacterium]|nr:diacylglycerol kinase family protein [Roseiflexaceae bacterium]
MQNVAHQPFRALIVFNPIAGQANSFEQDIQAARDVWREQGWQVDLRPTAGPGDGTQIAREAARQGYHLVVAAGGDGTVNEVVNGLAGTETALAALPIGTVNVWVRELGLPLQPRAAAEALLNAQIRTIDLGRAGDRYFLLMCGVGFDAAVTAEVRADEKRRFGALAYLLRAANLAGRFRGTPARITLDGRKVRGRVLMIVLGNSQLYGGVVKITARASLDDGLLDVCIIKGNSLWSAPLRALSVVRRRYSLDPEIEYHRAREIKISARRPLPVQVDGDHIGQTPMTFAAVPGALRALLPATLPEDLLRPEVKPPRYVWRRILSWVGGRLRRRATQGVPAEREHVERR